MTAFTPGLNSTAFTTFDSGVGDAGSEVVSHFDGAVYVTNGAQDRIDIFDIADNALRTSIDLTLIPGYGGVNSVSASAAGIAVAVENDDASQNGFVAIYDLDLAPDAEPSHLIEVGNLPDMVTYSKDATQIFVANEGEADGDDDPAGSISIIDVATGTAQTFGFDAFDAQADALQAAGVRLFPGKLPSTDFEPEYITQGDDGNLYVTLQEANAVAVFDLGAMAFTQILPLGTQDHSAPGFGLDPSDRDDAIDIRTAPVEGMRMPDAIASVEIDGQTYFLTANEGDARNEDERIADLVLDPTAFPDAATLQQDDQLGRLGVSSIDGDTDGDGDYDQLFSYGSRSFTIFDAAENIVFDSGDDFEQLIAQNRVPNAFNNDDFPSDASDVIDENRSDNKGPEPEAITVGTVDGRVLAFVGLERDSGIMIYDISDPANSAFVDYIDSSQQGDISPEVIAFIPAEDSTTGKPQIAVSYEVSGTTTLFDLAFGETLTGTDAGETLLGTDGDDVVFAAGGDDDVRGRDGDDVLFGDAGNDILRGNAGNDEIWGGTGENQLFGGSGNDSLGGNSDADDLWAGAGNDSVQGGAGNDRLGGDGGDDTLWAGDGDDLIYAGNGDDILGGGAGSDEHWGGAGDDTVYAGEGDDIIFGDLGNDETWGGGGNDLFIFTFGHDVVGGFEALNDAEKIDLSASAQITDFDDLQNGGHMSQVGNNVLIDDLVGNTITILDVALGDLDQNDFAF